MQRKVWMLCLLLSAAVVLHGPGAQAAMTGKDFLKATPSYQNGFVSGFVRGMYMTCLDHLEVKKQICSLDSVLDATFEKTPDQVLDMLLSYIRKKPELQQKDVSELLVDCLKDASGDTRQSK